MPKTSPSTTQKKARARKPVFGGSDASMNAISQYLEDISRYELLTAEQEMDYSKRSMACEVVKAELRSLEKELEDLEAEAEAFDDLEDGLHAGAIEDLIDRIDEMKSEYASVIQSGEEAQTALVNHNYRLVVTIAKDFRRSGIPFLDLIQAGNEGLMHAARKFDKEQFETPFANYAAYWVKQRLMKYTTEFGFATRIPPYRSWSLHKITKVSAQLMQRLGRTPTADEIAQETGYDLSEVNEIMTILQPDVDLDSSIKGDPAAGDLQNYFGESAAVAEEREESHVSQIAFRKIVEQALGVLSEREARILVLHFGLQGEREHGLDEIGDLYGFTKERARQIRAGALQKIRESGVIQDERE